MPKDKLKLDAVRLDDEMLSILEFKEGATEVEKKAVKERWKAAIADGTLVILYSDDGQVIGHSPVSIVRTPSRSSSWSSVNSSSIGVHASQGT